MEVFGRGGVWGSGEPIKLISSGLFCRSLERELGLDEGWAESVEGVPGLVTVGDSKGY